MPTSSASQPLIPTLVAPRELVAATRARFRQEALEFLERSVPDGATAWCIDLEGTGTVDASGLGILVLLEKRARERGLRTRLVGLSDDTRHLLSVTRLDSLFNFAD